MRKIQNKGYGVFTVQESSIIKNRILLKKFLKKIARLLAVNGKMNEQNPDVS
jgi:hypothetical protein